VCLDFCADHACYDCCAECAALGGRDCVALKHGDPHTSCSNSGCGVMMCMASAHCDCCY
jgi:hypothetical protein